MLFRSLGGDGDSHGAGVGDVDLGPGGHVRCGVLVGAVGVGREEALQFKGQATIGRKAEWPTWTPTANMIRRDPARYADYARGLPGGLENPLGARALYLYRGGSDTHFRLHGTTEPYSIGTNVSSGCIRLMNQDIIDLYARVPVGAKVVVINASSTPVDVIAGLPPAFT